MAKNNGGAKGHIAIRIDPIYIDEDDPFIRVPRTNLLPREALESGRNRGSALHGFQHVVDETGQVPRATQLAWFGDPKVVRLRHLNRLGQAGPCLKFREGLGAESHPRRSRRELSTQAAEARRPPRLGKEELNLNIRVGSVLLS